MVKHNAACTEGPDLPSSTHSLSINSDPFEARMRDAATADQNAAPEAEAYKSVSSALPEAPSAAGGHAQPSLAAQKAEEGAKSAAMSAAKTSATQEADARSSTAAESGQHALANEEAEQHSRTKTTHPQLSTAAEEAASVQATAEPAQLPSNAKEAVQGQQTAAQLAHLGLAADAEEQDDSAGSSWLAEETESAHGSSHLRLQALSEPASSGATTPELVEADQQHLLARPAASHALQTDTAELHEGSSESEPEAQPQGSSEGSGPRQGQAPPDADADSDADASPSSHNMHHPGIERLASHAAASTSQPATQGQVTVSRQPSQSGACMCMA